MPGMATERAFVRCTMARCATPAMASVVAIMRNKDGQRKWKNPSMIPFPKGMARLGVWAACGPLFNHMATLRTQGPSTRISLLRCAGALWRVP